MKTIWITWSIVKKRVNITMFYWKLAVIDLVLSSHFIAIISFQFIVFNLLIIYNLIEIEIEIYKFWNYFILGTY